STRATAPERKCAGPARRASRPLLRRPVSMPQAYRRSEPTRNSGPLNRPAASRTWRMACTPAARPIRRTLYSAIVRPDDLAPAVHDLVLAHVHRFVGTRDGVPRDARDAELHG